MVIVFQEHPLLALSVLLLRPFLLQNVLSRSCSHARDSINENHHRRQLHVNKKSMDVLEKFASSRSARRGVVRSKNTRIETRIFGFCLYVYIYVNVCVLHYWLLLLLFEE